MFHTFMLKRVTQIAPPTSTYDMIFRPCSTPAETRIMMNLYGSDDYTVTLREGIVTSNDGTQIYGYETDRVCSYSSCMTLYASPTITSLGTEIWMARLLAGKTPGGMSDYELRVRPLTKYLIRISRNGSQLGWVELDFWWREYFIESI